MADRPLFLTYKLDGARTRERVPKGGAYAKIVWTSSADANVNMAFDDNAENAFSAYKIGDEYDGSFDEFFLKNDAQAGESIVIMITDGKSRKNIASRTNIDAIAQPVVVKGGNTLAIDQVTVTDAAAAVEIIAAASSTTGWMVKNNSAIGTLYLGIDATVNNTDGYPIAPGEVIGWDVSDALYAYASGGDVDVRILRGSKV